MENDNKKMMDARLGSEIECLGQISGRETGSGSGEAARSQINGSATDFCSAPRIRPSEVKGFAVYTRNRRLKSVSMARIGSFDRSRDDSSVSSKGEVVITDSEVVITNGEVVITNGEVVITNGEVVITNGEVVVRDCDMVDLGAIEGSLGHSECRDGEMVEIEVKEEPISAVIRSRGLGKFTPSIINLKEDGMESKNSKELQDAMPLEVEGLMSDALTAIAAPLESKMEMSDKIVLKGRPTTVKELFETGLLKGYPVFYNGGKRGFPLRGAITDTGILCSCSLCKGVRVIPPCKFEIHACKVYRRASQYICLENGKSLLDVVKVCRKSSVKTLEESIRNFVGPIPVKKSFSICCNCEGTFLSMTTTKVERLCESCMIDENSQVAAECMKSRPLEPLSGLMTSEILEVNHTPQNNGRRGRKKRKHSEQASNTETPGRSSLEISTKKKGDRKIIRMRSEPSFTLKCPGNVLVSSSLSKASKSIVMKSKNSLKITKKDQKLHKLVFENGGLPDGTEVAYYSNGKKLRDGYKMGTGIICHCCSSLVSPSQFEVHAGWASRRKPYMYIYTSNGVSLHEFAVSLLKGRQCSAKDNDDLCTICADGGKLVLCDGCPRAFHKECASLLSIPHGKWFCTYCQNMFQRERFITHNANAVAAGRVLGIDPIEYITNRCIRTVKNPEEAEVIACIICRSYDFCKSGFGPRTVILCDQCEKEYHVGCLKKCKMADLKELPKGKWFCSVNCKKMYFILQNLVNAGAEKLPEASLNILNKYNKSDLVAGVDLDVRWRLLNGKITSRETRVLLSQAVAIFHDSFDPIVDLETGRDFIPSMVYGRNIRGQDFSGMYCAILTVNSAVVSAGIIRIFGEDLAELPLAATRRGNQGKGYFQLLYSCIEKLLAFLNVRKFVLPAADEAKSIWTEKFGFEKIPETQLLNYGKICWQMITFKGTSMLEKTVPRCRIINQGETESHDPCNNDL